MGSRGPTPKRSDQRERRNKENGEVEKLPATGKVAKPELLIEDPHPITEQWYDALDESAQTEYYEPSDWAWAQVIAFSIDHYVKSNKPSSMMLSALNTSMSSLLVTEGDRRRVNLEIERAQAANEVADISQYLRERNSS